MKSLSPYLLVAALPQPEIAIQKSVMVTISVLSPHRHPRLRYALAELGRELGWRFVLTTDVHRWNNKRELIKISFTEIFGGVKYLLLPLHQLLNGRAPTPTDIKVRYPEGLPSFFAVGNDYDYLSCIFYVLSRYEEYGDEARRDSLGRFLATDSHAVRNDYLHLPVVRRWAAEIARQLREVFPDLPPPTYPAFAFRPTYDIDLLWAWRHRGIRGVGAGVRDVLRGHFKRGLQRFISSADDDPYLTLPWLEALHDEYDLEPIYFWLLADSSRSEDTNPYPIPADQITWVERIAERRQTGIHPSFESMNRHELFRQEADRLTEIVGRQTSRSRQHWLRFRLPGTYRALQLAGITQEYSMGYADAIGWRAGTNRAFYWYDLEREKTTGLRIHPFAAMDVTLKNYLKLSADEARTQVQGLADGIAEYGGEFQLLWHNSSFTEWYGWEGWREMYADLVAGLGEGTKPNQTNP